MLEICLKMYLKSIFSFLVLSNEIFRFSNPQWFFPGVPLKIHVIKMTKFSFFRNQVENPCLMKTFHFSKTAEKEQKAFTQDHLLWKYLILHQSEYKIINKAEPININQFSFCWAHVHELNVSASFFSSPYFLLFLWQPTLFRYWKHLK